MPRYTAMDPSGHPVEFYATNRDFAETLADESGCTDVRAKPTPGPGPQDDGLSMPTGWDPLNP
jgi:hypothetical protein